MILAGFAEAQKTGSVDHTLTPEWKGWAKQKGGGGGGNLCFSDRDNCHSNMKFWLILCFEQVEGFFESLLRKKLT